MSMVRLALVGALVLVLMAESRADGDKGGKPDIQKKLIGKWEIVKFTGKNDGLPAKAIVEFTKDGKMITTWQENGERVQWKGTYKVEGKWLTATRQRGDREQTQKIKIIKVDDKELIVGDEERELSLKRKKP